jgi:hypothetical protein
VPIAYDDGEADNATGPGDPDFVDFVMRFDLPRAGMRVDEVSVCLARLGSSANLDLDLTFWTADGPGGEPGTLIDFVGATALGVPVGLNSSFFDFDLSDLEPPVVLPPSTVYLGVGWQGDPPIDEFYICYDADRPTVQPGYVDFNQAEDWFGLETAAGPDYTALLLRGVFSDFEPGGPCVPDDTTLCLLGDRFRVEVDWETQFGTEGPGHVVPFGSDSSGLFYFFNPNNWAMLFKMLDACSLSPPRFWVFFAATTNVEFTITVTDTQTGLPKFYFNELGHPADAVTDTSAFATCP